MNLIHIKIYCYKVNYKVNLKHYAFHSLQESETHNLLNIFCLIVDYKSIACRLKTNMASYIAVTSRVLFLLKSFEERGFQKSVFQVKSDSYKG